MDITATFNNFETNWIGKRVADPTLGQLGANSLPQNQWYQCVSLVKEYLKLYGISAGFWGDAYQYWSQTNPALLAKFDKIPGANPPQKGDIVVLNGNHIAIASGNNSNGNMEILEQNGQTGGGSGTGGDAIRTRFVPISRMASSGALRPNSSVRAVPAPAAPAIPAHQPQHVGEILRLPDSEETWRVYAPTGPYTSAPVDYSIHKLAPKQYATNGFLEYEVLANPAQDIYLINTSMFGTMAIWGGSPASFRAKDVASAPAAPAPAPQPAPAATGVAHPYVVESIAPIILVGDVDRTEWNLDNQNWPDFAKNPIKTLPAGQKITAVARAHHSLGSFYYMEDPNVAAGYNIVDLHEYVEPAAAPAAPAPVVQTLPDAPITPTTTPKPDVAITPGLETPKPGDVVAPAPVNTSPFSKLTPKDIQLAKDQSRQSIKAVVSATDITVYDLDGKLAPQAVAGQKLIPVAREVWINGSKYYRTIQSEAKKEWYLIPEKSTGNVNTNQLKRAQQILDAIYEKYKDLIDDELDEFFREGMKFEEELKATKLPKNLQKLKGRDRLVDLFARVLFGKNKKQK